MDPARVRKLLVIKFFGIGSLVLATPLLRRAREVFPNAEIHLLTLASNKAVAPMLPGLDRVRFIDLGRDVVQAVAAYAGCLRDTFRERYDAVIDMEFYTRASAVVSLASWAPVRVGYHSRGVYRGDIPSHRVPFNVYWHVARNFLNLLAPFGHPAGDDVPTPALTLPDGRMADHGLGDRLVVVNVNAGELAYERRWPPDRYAALAAMLSATYGLPCAFTGSAGERDYVEAVVAEVNRRGGTAVNLAGRLGLDEMARLCRASLLTISNDSGPLHVAAAVGARVAGFFGPETPVLYGPVGEGHLVFHTGLDCSPCINVEHGKRLACWHATPLCQEGTTPEAAFAAIRARFGARLEQEPGRDDAPGRQ